MIGLCSDDEDTVSMAYTVLDRLMKRCKLDYADIGRLEVGTESGVDRAKSVKSFLMARFEASGNHNVEGADTTNACYGGTNALFNTVQWVQSPTWDGRYGILICSDVAVYPGLPNPDSTRTLSFMIMTNACCRSRSPSKLRSLGYRATHRPRRTLCAGGIFLSCLFLELSLT